MHCWRAGALTDTDRHRPTDTDQHRPTDTDRPTQTDSFTLFHSLELLLFTTVFKNPVCWVLIYWPKSPPWINEISDLLSEVWQAHYEFICIFVSPLCSLKKTPALLFLSWRCSVLGEPGKKSSHRFQATTGMTENLHRHGDGSSNCAATKCFNMSMLKAYRLQLVSTLNSACVWLTSWPQFADPGEKLPIFNENLADSFSSLICPSHTKSSNLYNCVSG